MSQNQYPPIFATNRPARRPGDEEETVAAQVNWLLAGARRLYTSPPNVAIAAAYVNPGGFALLADELERAPRVRLLLGAEPEPGTDRPRTQQLAEEQLRHALSRHQKWLAYERDLTGFTREADAAARRLLRWIRSVDRQGTPRVEVRRYARGFLHGKAFVTEHPQMPAVLAGSSNFTFAGLTRNAELNLGYPTGQHTGLVQEWFDEMWAASEPYDLAKLYAPRWDPHDPWTIFMRMLWEAYGADLEADDDEKIRTALRLTRFQREGVARMLRILERHNGVIVADEVGLGKTYMAGEVIQRATARRRQQVLIVSPAALKAAMWLPFLREHDFSRRVDVKSFDELRLAWQKGAKERARLDDYALVVVDEAHNLRNPQAQRTDVVHRIAGGANPKQLVLLTATPVNNSLYDLHTLVSLFIRNDAALAFRDIPSISGYIRRAQQMSRAELSHEHLFGLMDEVAVRRTRQFIKRHYAGDHIEGAEGPIEITFPTAQLGRIDYELDPAGTALLDAVVYALDFDGDTDDFTPYHARTKDPNRLLLARYTPDAYRIDREFQFKRQAANAGLLRSTILKRMESSTAALRGTLRSVIGSHNVFLEGLAAGYVLSGEAIRKLVGSDAEYFDEILDSLGEERNSIDEYHVADLERDVRRDLRLLGRLLDMAGAITEEPKADRLIARLAEIARQSRRTSADGVSSGDRRKVIVFSTFVDTIRDLHQRVERAVDGAEADNPLADFAGRMAEPVFGSKTGIDQGHRADVIGSFAPRTAGDGHEDLYDMLLTTDVLAEGVNLQQAGRIVNYDLPWNPMRIVQRHGRIDRIGSPHRRVRLDCFFPTASLDKLLRLASRLRDKLALADAAVGPGPVLPGVESTEGHVFSDDIEAQIEQLRNEDATLLDSHRGNASGEELRQRLRSAIEAEGKSAFADLPHGSGSGFVNSRLATHGYVFCIRVTPAASSSNRNYPCRFRFVRTDANWRCLKTADGSPVVNPDALTSLLAADPGSPSTPRALPERAYDQAFDAWQAARDEVYAEWMRLTDPQNLQPAVPKALRDSSALVLDHGTFLGYDEQNDLLQRLNTAPPERTVRLFRQLMRGEASARQKVVAIRKLAREVGLEPAQLPEPHPPIDPGDVRLVAWMAVMPDQPVDTAPYRPL